MRTVSPNEDTGLQQQPNLVSAEQSRGPSGVARALPAISRILLASLFLWSGIGKLLDPSGTIQYIASFHLPAPVLGFWIAVVVELVGGLFLVIGYKVGAVAAVMALFTLMAAVIFHADWADVNQMTHFMKNIAIVGGFLALAIGDAGGTTGENSLS